MKEINYHGFRWLFLATMFIVTVIASIFLIAPAPLIPEMMKTMPGLSAGQVTIITMSVFNILVIVSTILGGPLLDKFGIMKVYIGSLILITFGALLMPFLGSSFGGMIFIRILQGLGTGPIIVSVIPIAAIYFPVKLRTIPIILEGCAVTSGIKIGLILIPRILNSTQSWQAALAWLATISIPGLIFSFIAASSEKKSKEGICEIITPINEDLKPVLLKSTWVAIACTAIFSWVYQAFNNLIPPYFNTAPPQGLGYDPAALDSLLSVSYLLLICGGIVGILITEIFLRGNARPVVLAGFVLAAVSIYLIGSPAMASNHTILGTSVCATLFFSACISILALGYIAKYYPRHIIGTLGGIACGISILAGLAGAAVSSIAMKYSGYQTSFSIMACIAVIGAIAALFLKPVKED